MPVMSYIKVEYDCEYLQDLIFVLYFIFSLQTFNITTAKKQPICLSVPKEEKCILIKKECCRAQISL
jgi:hypothetical protein